MVAGCGAAEPNRFDLRTPGTRTGAPLAQSTPEPAATATATATPGPRRKPVTSAERRVVKGWSESLRGGHVSAAARYFSVPTMISDVDLGEHFLGTQSEIEAFNRKLSCATKLVRMRRGTDGFVVGIFEQTERKGSKRCAAVGEPTAVAFLIRSSHIQQWVRIDPSSPDATPTPTPAPAETPSATPKVS
jgi:hypothetical protein